MSSERMSVTRFNSRLGLLNVCLNLNFGAFLHVSVIAPSCFQESRNPRWEFEYNNVTLKALCML